ncbi:MAG TPA: hypothetical protein VGM98_08100 [Schlesneria sp.]|jgi:hypothetical protein
MSSKNVDAIWGTTMTIVPEKTIGWYQLARDPTMVPIPCSSASSTAVRYQNLV